MRDAIESLYKNPSEQQKMFLKENMRNSRIQKGEGINPSLTKFQDIRDELAAVGESPTPTELVHLAFNNVTEEWETFF